MDNDKLIIIETLTGIRSSKKNYCIELQQKIEEVTLRNQQLEIINRVTKSFNLNLPLLQLINCLIGKLKTVLLFDEFHLSTLIEGEYRSISWNVTMGDSCKYLPFRPNEIHRHIIKNKISLILPAETQALGVASSDTSCPGLFNNVCPGAALFVPLVAEKRVVGILEMKNSKSEQAFSQQDLTFLMQLSEHLTVGLNNIRLFSEVLKNKQQWEDVFKSVTDALVLVDVAFKIISFNEAAARLFHIDDTEIEAKKCYEIIHRSQEPCKHCPMSGAFFETKRKFRFKGRNSKEFYDIYGYPTYGQDGRLSGVMETFKDVTKLIAIESQLIQSEKLAAIGKLAAVVAHELNSPLTAILGNALLLLREQHTNEDHTILLKDIKYCGMRCKNIVQNLLSYGRNQNEDVVLFSINDVIRRAIRIVDNQFILDKITIISLLGTDLPNVIGSAQQLEQVVINLLINARDALEGRENNRTVTVTSGYREMNGEEYLFFSVEDEGCGINSEDLQHIFTPFFTTKNHGKGTGLGLAVSMDIIKNHRGLMECNSIHGFGSRFTVLLPPKQKALVAQ